MGSLPEGQKQCCSIQYKFFGDGGNFIWTVTALLRSYKTPLRNAMSRQHLWKPLQLTPKGKCHRAHQKQKRDSMIPFDTFTEIPPREDDEHTKSDYLLDDF
jgi:hypothetical protein